jgi:hypothetical protein
MQYVRRIYRLHQKWYFCTLHALVNKTVTNQENHYYFCPFQLGGKCMCAENLVSISVNVMMVELGF